MGCWENRGTIQIASGTRVGGNVTVCGASNNYGTIEGEGAFEWSHHVLGYVPFRHHPGAVIDVDRVRLQSTTSGSPVVLEGSITARELEFTNGVFTISGNIQAARLFGHRPLYASNTTLNSNGTITVTELFSMGSTTLGSTGTTTVAAGGAIEWLQLDITASRTITGGHTLINNGTATWGPMSGGQVTIAAGSTLRNNGTFTVQNNQPMTGAGTFRNFGVLTKTTEGASSWAVCYVQESGGSYVPNPGTIAFTGSCP